MSENNTGDKVWFSTLCTVDVVLSVYINFISFFLIITKLSALLKISNTANLIF